jgi:hypothetical protein
MLCAQRFAGFEIFAPQFLPLGIFFRGSSRNFLLGVLPSSLADDPLSTRVNYAKHDQDWPRGPFGRPARRA